MSIQGIFLLTFPQVPREAPKTAEAKEIPGILPALEEALEDPKVKETMDTFQLEESCIHVTKSKEKGDIYADKDGIHVYEGLNTSKIVELLPQKIRDYKKLISAVWGGGDATKSNALKEALNKPRIKSEMERYGIKAEDIHIYFNPSDGATFRTTNKGIYLYGGSSSEQMVKDLNVAIKRHYEFKVKFSELKSAAEEDSSLRSMIKGHKIDLDEDVIITDRNTTRFRGVSIEKEYVENNKPIPVKDLKINLREDTPMLNMIWILKVQIPEYAEAKAGKKEIH